MIARHDFDRPRARPKLVAPPADDSTPKVSCALGGLKNVMVLQLAEATSHVASCNACTNELAKPRAHLPVARNYPAPETSASTAPSQSPVQLRSASNCGSALQREPSKLSRQLARETRPAIGIGRKVETQQSFRTRSIGGLPVVCTPDYIDISNAHQLSNALLDATEGATDVVVDMTITTSAHALRARQAVRPRPSSASGKRDHREGCAS